MIPATTPRIEPRALADWSEDDKQLLRGCMPRADRFLSGAPDSPLPPILGMFARHPQIGGPWLAYNGALLDHGRLDGRSRELLVLRVAQRTRCAYLWSEHRGMAVAAGLTEDEIAALQDDGAAPPWGEGDADLLCATDELIVDHVVSDATWARLTDHLDEQQLLELPFAVGTYVALAMVLNSVGLQPAPGPDEQED